MTENSWPNNKRRALSQCEHNSWNSRNYPGTREICCECGDTTGNCEEDNITDEEGCAYCLNCAIGAGLIEGEHGN